MITIKKIHSDDYSKVIDKLSMINNEEIKGCLFLYDQEFEDHADDFLNGLISIYSDPMTSNPIRSLDDWLKNRKKIELNIYNHRFGHS
jgi:hypothetical protein